MPKPRPLPPLVDVGPIPMSEQALKVGRHLYNVPEAWGLLCGAAIPALRYDAKQAGCPPCRRETFWRDAVATCVRLARAHHDQYYQPTYMAELREPETVWAANPRGELRWLALSPRSVVISVDREANWAVVTAFRPTPEEATEPMSPSELARLGRRYFKENIEGKAQPMDDWLAELEDDLRREVPAETPAQARWLARCLGEGLAWTGLAALRAATAKAQRAWDATDAAVKAELRDHTDVDRLVQALADDLAAGAEVEVNHGLHSAADLLAVLQVIDTGQADHLLNRLIPLVGDLPRDWSWVSAQVDRRAQRWRGAAPGHPVSRFWQAAAAARAGAQPSLLGRLASAAKDAVAELAAPLQQALAALAPAAPAPVMGTGPAASEPWVLRWPTVTPPTLRVFVVDADYPQGYEVSDLVQSPANAFWRLEAPGQSAVVVAIDSVGTAPDLAAALAQAQQAGRPVAWRVVSRPR